MKEECNLNFSLCWTCSHSYGCFDDDCCWAKGFYNGDKEIHIVEGWVAKPLKLLSQGGDGVTFKILKCPLYEKENRKETWKKARKKIVGSEL